jgi:dienelactone hydrolase
MKKVMFLFALAIFGACVTRAQDIVGDWQGTLHVGGGELRLVVHITKAADGTLTGTMDSIDQNVSFPISDISFKDKKLTFEVKSIQGAYEATLADDGSSIKGTWNQGAPLPLELKRTTSPLKSTHKPAPPSDIDGVWMGSLAAGPSTLRLVFHITNTEDGLTATMDSPDQGVNGLPVTAVKREGSALTLELKQAGAAFTGTIDKDVSTIDGTWSQGGGSAPLVLKRVKDTAGLELRRPQMPVKPYPYRDEDVRYENKSAPGVTLAATITIPQGKGPFPAVLLICGSGQHDRDETIFGHKPFLVLADYLTRKGVIVLRADKRGYAKSTGDYTKATTADFATDAEAGIAYLMSRPEVNPHKIGLIGHSEGGVIAPLVAARNSNVAFIVMMAGPGVRGDEIIIKQGQLMSEADGTSHEEAAANAVEERKILTMVEAEKDDETLKKDLMKEFGDKIPEAQAAMQIRQATSPWFRYFLTYDPAIALQKVKCPVLALIGGKDLQVPASQNLEPIRKALAAGGNHHADVEELPGLNHLFQTAKTGSLTEYGKIEETIAPLALTKISSWVVAQ